MRSEYFWISPSGFQPCEYCLQFASTPTLESHTFTLTLTS
jgi:hypothetical protein